MLLALARTATPSRYTSGDKDAFAENVALEGKAEDEAMMALI